MQKTSTPHPPEKPEKIFHEPSCEPVFIPLEPPEETPLPDESTSWPMVVLIGGLIVALACAWWFAPATMDALWQNLIHRLFHFAGQ